MQRRWIAVVACVLAAGFFALPSTAEARRGRGSSPFVYTPYGPIPKSVYLAPYVNNPQALQKMQQAEQKAMQKMQGGTNSNSNTAKKPTTKKKT